jgi:hypothetical protein
MSFLFYVAVGGVAIALAAFPLARVFAPRLTRRG